MNLQQVLDMPPGKTFKYKGANAQVVWVDKIKYLIVKGDKNSSDLVKAADVYFKNSAIFFTCEGRPEGITLTTCFPKPEFLPAPDFSL